MSNYDLSPLFRQWIGFDKLASNIQDDFQGVSYPPYNIEKGDDNHYRITLALAGFTQQELSIELEGPRLTIKGALLNKSELADRMALYYTCYPILTLCGIPNNVIRFSALTIA
ncbi:Hsp20 family protein, partial [Sodalis sp. (in: enterobacteria)]|uniref:Hsp20 family protein n=1 Tax=Sodalis sp. (in: enterobacteria) TaxID=1898979 RepID=UPI003F3E3567